jgi:hypothetical protein
VLSTAFHRNSQKTKTDYEHDDEDEKANLRLNLCVKESGGKA